MKSYEKSLFRQLTETIEENDNLKIQVKELQSENASLKKEVTHLRKK